jgi:hypothetical protein
MKKAEKRRKGRNRGKRDNINIFNGFMCCRPTRAPPLSPDSVSMQVRFFIYILYIYIYIYCLWHEREVSKTVLFYYYYFFFKKKKTLNS